MVAAPPSVLPEAAVAAGNAALSEDEFQDILTRNKSVSSSAINRAVQDASTGRDMEHFFDSLSWASSPPLGITGLDNYIFLR